MTRKILIVEDDAATAAYLAKGLGEAGYAIDQAADGRDGLFLASEGGYDLIVADRMLPGLDGLAMISALRAAHIATPVLILSALGTVDHRSTACTPARTTISSSHSPSPSCRRAATPCCGGAIAVRPTP